MKTAIGKLLVLATLTALSVMFFSSCDGNYSVPTYTDPADVIETNVGREFIIALDANPSTGFGWREDYDDANLKLISKEYKPDEKAAGLVGAGGTQYYRFQARHLGQTNISIVYQQAGATAPIEERLFNVNIEPRVNREGGEMSTKQYGYEGFKKIEVGSAFEVEVIRGEAYSVSITADDFPHIKCEQIGDTLQIGRQGIEWFAPFHQQPVARITVPGLEGLTLAGATRGRVSDIQSGQELTVKVSGASNLVLVGVQAAGLTTEVTGASTLSGEIEVKGNVRLIISGASKVELTGTAIDIAVNVSGASKCDLIRFPARNADVEVSGASNGWVNLNGRLDANVSGASNLIWTGNPTMGDISTSGASNLRRK